MERLTIPDVRVDEHTTRRSVIDVAAVREHAMKIYWRLKSYEDTGLTPERCAEFARADAEGRYIVMRDAEQEGVARLRELAEADKAWRCVVLPCKVGDTLWLTSATSGVYNVKVRTFFCGHPSAVRGTDDDGGIQMIRTTQGDIPIKNFKKIAFFTREEAERAMEGKKNGDKTSL